MKDLDNVTYQLYFGNSQADAILCNSLEIMNGVCTIKLQTPLGEIKHTADKTNLILLLNFLISTTCDKWDEFFPEWDFKKQRNIHSKYDETLQAASALFTYIYYDIMNGRLYPTITIYDKLPPRNKLYVYSSDIQHEMTPYADNLVSCNMLRYNLICYLIKNTNDIRSYKLWCSLFSAYINTECDLSMRIWSSFFGGPRQVSLGAEKQIYRQIRADHLLHTEE